MYKYTADFFRRQLNETAEGKVARAYLEDRGLDRSAIDQFGLGYAPSGGKPFVVTWGKRLQVAKATAQSCSN